MLKLGDKGIAVIELQEFLNTQGANLKVDGDFGKLTQTAVINYQIAHKMPVTGRIELTTNSDEKRIVSDFLSPTQYVGSKSAKRGVCLHHTASGGDARAVRRVWDGDNRGRVATHFIVGSDGLILQAIPLDNWAYHIAMGRMGFGASHNNMINGGYIGIEICNWGYLEQKKGKFYNYLDKEVPSNEAVKLDKPFRHYEYWHKYTDKQVDSVRWLLGYLRDKFGFEYENKLPLNEWWLELSFSAMRGERVLTTHTNFEVGKWDCSPQENFFKMVKNL